LITSFAEPVPVMVIARFLGVPDDMAPQILGWSHDMVAMYQARRDCAIEERAVSATVAFTWRGVLTRSGRCIKQPLPLPMGGLCLCRCFNLFLHVLRVDFLVYQIGFIKVY
jgi:hypothetical protein